MAGVRARDSIVSLSAFWFARNITFSTSTISSIIAQSIGVVRDGMTLQYQSISKVSKSGHSTLVTVAGEHT